MYKFFVGIDVSKEWIDASWTDGPKTHYLSQFKNSIPGFRGMLKQLNLHSSIDKEEWFICFENTGTYSKLLLEWLCSQGIPCREESSLKISKESGLKRGKNDKLDSKVICEYGYRNRDRISPSVLPLPAIQELKKLLTRRDLLVRHRRTLLSSLKEQEKEFVKATFELLEAQNKKLLLTYEEGIDQIESRIREIIRSKKELQSNAALVESVIGIGPVITWYLISYTNNFKSFEHYRQFANYCGLAPHPNTSGKSFKGKTGVSKMGNRQIKSIISNGVNKAIQHDPQLHNYYERKIKEGKHKGVVLNVVKNKLLARAFATVHRGKPFVKLDSYI
jgi:transposase